MIGLGLLAAIAAGLANALAAGLQGAEARAIPAVAAARVSLLGQLMRRPRWLLGTAFMVLAWPLQLLALALAPITVVQPGLASFQLSLLLLARFRFGEPVGRREALGGAAIAAGIIAVVLAAPRRMGDNPAAGRLAAPLAVVGAIALLTYAFTRARGHGDLLLTVGAGLGYAWIDFANKLFSNTIAGGRWGLAAIWLVTIIGMGTLALVQENGALQSRQVVRVAPVVGAIADPLPVLMALWAGAEAWAPSPGRIAPLAAGLALVVAGAFTLARSPNVATLRAS